MVLVSILSHIQHSGRRWRSRRDVWRRRQAQGLTQGDEAARIIGRVVRRDEGQQQQQRPTGLPQRRDGVRPRPSPHEAWAGRRWQRPRVAWVRVRERERPRLGLGLVRPCGGVPGLLRAASARTRTLGARGLSASNLAQTFPHTHRQRDTPCTLR